jgi:hypothetical protein
LADIALVVIALAASINGHVMISRVAIIACALLSLSCQIGAHMSNAGHAIELASSQNQALARALGKIEEAKNEAKTARNQAVIARNHAETARHAASSITEHGTPSDLEAAMRRASGKADTALKAAGKAKKACRDAEGCQAALDSSAAAKNALSQAHSRVSLFAQATQDDGRARQFDGDATRADAKAERAEAERAQIGGPAKSDGATAFFVAYGWDETAATQWSTVGRTGMLIVTLLILQMLGGYAGRTINNGIAGRRAAAEALETARIEAARQAEAERVELATPKIEAAPQFVAVEAEPETDPLAQAILEATVEEMWSEFMEFGGKMAEEMSDTTGATLAVASEPEASATGTEIAVATPPGPKGGKPAVKPKAKKKTAPKAIKTPPTASAATVIRFRSRPGVEVAKRSKTLNEALAKQYGVA